MHSTVVNSSSKFGQYFTAIKEKRRKC